MFDLEGKIPEYLVNKQNITRQILFTAIFALVFINIYAPFGVNTWFDLTRFQLFLYSSGLILTGVLVVAISRIMMFRHSLKKSLNNLQYGIWTLVEIFSMSLVYTLLKISVLRDNEDLVVEFQQSLEITALVVLPPYLISGLFFAWQDKSRKLESLEHSSEPSANESRKLIPFKDEKGTLRFSLKPDDVLYLEAADNYVIIHYIHQQRLARYMLRNSLKKLEDALGSYDMLRCHRSYMVNFNRVKLIRREKEGLLLELDAPAEIVVPVSKTYAQRVTREFIKMDTG